MNLIGCLDSPTKGEYYINGRLVSQMNDDELALRRAAWVPPSAHYQRGYGALFSQHVLQADEGCDFDFLAKDGFNPEPEIH